MDKEQAEKTTWRILGEVEEMMSGRGVGILSYERSDHHWERAFFQDHEYSELEETIVDILGTTGRGDDDGRRTRSGDRDSDPR